MASKVAVFQRPPKFLDLQESRDRVVQGVGEAAEAGAQLVLFPEAYLPGYPTWIWRLRPGGDMGLSGEIHARLRKNAVDISGGDLVPVREAASAVGLNALMRSVGTTLAAAVMGTILTGRTMPLGPGVEVPTLGAFQLCFVAGALAAFAGVAIAAAIPRRSSPEPAPATAQREARTAA